MKINRKIKTKFYPGNGMYLKHYKTYFEKWLEFTDNLIEAEICLCHSRGIENVVLENKTLPVVVMDPSLFLETHLKTIIFYNDNREDVPKIVRENITMFPYKGDHYPYKNKNIRDKIVKCMYDLTSS